MLINIYSKKLVLLVLFNEIVLNLVAYHIIFTIRRLKS